MAQQQNPNLSEEQKQILFNKGTEAPGSGTYLHTSDDGSYHCANCNAVLFSSDAKYDSRTPGLIGWPSFDSAIEGAVEFVSDDSLGMSRTEVTCKKCGAHLGHIFDADDAETGKHYCINSACLDFKPESNG